MSFHAGSLEINVRSLKFNVILLNFNVTSIIKVSNQCHGFTRSLNTCQSTLKLIGFILSVLTRYCTS